MKHTIVFALLSAPTAAIAGTPFYSPPKGEFLYDGPLIEHVFSTMEMARAVCTWMSGGPVYVSCQYWERKTCHIIVYNDPAKPAWVYQAIRRHEVAHCAGWTHP